MSNTLYIHVEWQTEHIVDFQNNGFLRRKGFCILNTILDVIIICLFL